MHSPAYFYLSPTPEASAKSEPETESSYGLFFQRWNWLKLPSRVLLSLLFFLIALTPVSWSGSALAINKGTTSSEVTELQKKLEAAGHFNGPITGYYGPMTEAAVKQFQSARGMNADGIAGSETLAALGLNSETAAPDQPLTQSKVNPADDPDISPKAAVGFQKSKITPADEPDVTPESTVGLQQSKITPADEPEATPESNVGLQQSKTTPANEPDVAPESAVVLQKGDRNSQVSTLQKKLQAAGYFSGPITGYYGSLTQAAVMKFQAAKGLSTNGIADSSTLNAIASSHPAESTTSEVPDDPSMAPQKAVPDDPKTFRQSDIVLRRGNRSADVTSLQKQLQAAGYFKGPITGYYGAMTQSAVLEFQKAKGLMADGIAASETLSELQTSTGESTPSSTTTQPTTPSSAFNDEPFIEKPDNLNKPQEESSSPQALEEEAKKKRTPRMGVLTFQE